VDRGRRPAAAARTPSSPTGARRFHDALAGPKEFVWTTGTQLDFYPDTAQCLHNLADVLYEQGDLDNARSLHERALAIREAYLGADHPDTAQSLNNLALVLRDEGDLDAARGLHERALAIYEARLGADHPDTVQSRENLAAVLAALDEQQ
jgi:tetratricopeptide (TPR) repeat protein